MSKIQVRKLLVVLIALPAVVLFALSLKPTATHAQTPPWPTSPPAQICGNTTLLSGPSTAPSGAITVPAGDNSSYNFNQTGVTFYFESGVHTLANDQYGQIITRNGNTYIGAPGAILDGQNINKYAFTNDASNVTIKYLTIRNFGSGMDNNNEGVVNHDSGTGWTVEYNTITNNDGAGVFIGTDNVVRYNCLKDNGQYGFSMFKPPVEGERAIKNIELDHNEIVGNNQDDWESEIEGCGCTGGGKFWDVEGATITNNWVHDNLSVGLWADTNNVDFLFEGNYIEDNEDEGIWYEISYNATIRNNTIKQNAWAKGERNQGSPAPAIYLSESGGDSRLAATVSGSTKLRVYDNYFEDNFSGVSIYENANRFCNSNGNTSKGYCTPFVSPNLIPTPHDYDYADPINASHPCYTNVANEPHKSDCRWNAQNIEVYENEFHFDDQVVPCVGTYCGAQALIATGADNLSWSPYTVSGIQNDVMFNNGNLFYDNVYVGNWKFAKGWGETISFSSWQASPYNQDDGSTISGQTGPTATPTPTAGPTATPTPTQAPSGPVANHLDSNTATLESTIGQWAAWFSASVARTSEAAHSGANSLKITVTEPFGWGVELANWPGFDATPGSKVINVWGKLGSGTNIQPTMTVKWLNSSNSVLQTDVVPLPTLTSSWQRAKAYVTAPAGTDTVLVTFSGSGSANDYMYIDDVVVGDFVNVVDTDSSGLEASVGQWAAWYSSTVTTSTASAHTGAKSLLMTVTDPWGWGVQSDNWPGFDASSGTKRITFWAKQAAGNITNVSLRVKWRDVNGDTVKTDVVPLTGLDTTWKISAMDVLAPANTETVSLEFYSTSGSVNDALYLDDISIVDVTNVLNTNSSGFESTVGDWSDWYSATISTSSAQSYSGSQSLVVNVTDPWGWGAYIDNWPGYATTPGDKRVSFSARQGSGSISNVSLRAQWLDANGDLLQTDTLNIGSLSTSWKRASAQFTSPAGTATYYLELISSSGTIGDAVYIDEIIVADVEE